MVNVLMVTNNEYCPWRRFVTLGSGFEDHVIVSSAKARDFQAEFTLSDEEAQAVSDHYPVELQIEAAAATVSLLTRSISRREDRN